MNPPSTDIKDILESSSVAAGTFGIDLFISIFPDSPDFCILLKDTMSWRSPETNGSGIEYPGLQVLVRGTPSGYLEAYSLAEDIKNELHILTNVRQGTYYNSIACSTDILDIGRDKKNRPIFSLNFEIMRQP